MASIVLATSTRLPTPDPELEPLCRALTDLGAEAGAAAWDQPFDWAAADLVVIRSTWDYFEHLDDFLGWLREVRTVTRLVNPEPVIRWNTHKSYLTEMAAQGVPTVPTVHAPRGSDVPDLGSLFPKSTEVVLKPAVSINAIGALRAAADDPAATKHLCKLLAAGDVLIQPFLPSVVAEGETSLLFFGDELSHAVRKVPRAGDYRVQDVHGGSVHPHEATGAELAVAAAALATVPEPCAYARVDVVTGPDGPCLMELELIEPTLFLDTAAGAADRFARVLLERTR